MSEALRRAAAHALAAEAAGGADGEVRRVTLDVAVGDQVEIVTVTLDGDGLRWSSTGDPDAGHVTAALRFLAGEDIPRTAVRTGDPALEAPSPRLSWPPEAPTEETDGASARIRLADALDDVVTAIVRAGIDEQDSPSVSDSLERLRKEAPLPLPPGLNRWLGRLRDALEQKDAPAAAQLLDGAAQLARCLRRERPTPSVRRRVAAWLGASGERKVTEQLSDRTLVEVAREWLRSGERAGMERRYLVDVHNGEVFREERDRARARASIGPCPRRLHIGLAEVEDTAPPRRLRPMQYEVGLGVSSEDLDKIELNGYRRFAALADRYREQLDAHPGQAEPFAVVVPKRWKDGDSPLALDDDGEPLAFARAEDPAAIEVLRSVVPKKGPRWVAGRLLDVDGCLMMLPCSVAVLDGDALRIHRLR